MSEWLPGTWAPKGPPVVNTFTNPSFEAGAGTVEVWRQRILNPRAEVGKRAASWGTGGAGTTSVVGSGVDAAFAQTWTTGATGGTAKTDIAYGDYRIPVAPGEVSTVAVEVARALGGTVRVQLAWDRADLSFISLVNGTAVTVSTDWQTPTEISATGTAPAGAAFLRFSVNLASNPASGEVLYHRKPRMNGVPYFDPDYSDIPDMTGSWTGPVNASPSILTAVRAAATDAGWQSSQWAASGARSLYVPAGAVQEFTLTDQTLIVTPRSGSQTVLVNDAPTTAGVEFRHQGTAIVGLGEGWWDNLAIIQGVYDGPNFDGSTPDTDQWTYSWTGPVDASTSTRQEMEAVMATIYGTLTDFGLQTLTPYKPVLKFTPSGPGVKGRKVFSGRPVEVPVASSGAFAVLLEPTDGVTPEVWYTVSIEYLNEGGQYTSLDILGYRLFVPAPGGAIGDLPGAPLSSDTVLVGLNPPPPGYRGWWLYSPAEGEEMPADETGIGDLRMVA